VIVPEPTTCPHGKRAGIAVCLYCRQDARVAKRQRRNKTAVRIGVLALGGGVLIALAVGAVVAVVPRGRPEQSPEVPVVAAPVATPSRPRADASVRPIIAEGRTELGDSIFAERTGAEVTVHFDNASLRTRFDDKFERIVRMSLPMIFGPEVGARLDSVSPGQFVRGGDLLTDLPSRGIPLALPARGRTLMLYPVTRQGQDGPLVVGYRVTVAR
jgi:hypothetical protein